MTSGPDRPAIERFVRGTLGCQCPDEVFRSVAIEHVPAGAGRPSLVQLLVGSRLLIHVVAAPATIPANRWIEQLAAHGRAARDRHGYNRFRLGLKNIKKFKVQTMPNQQALQMAQAGNIIPMGGPGGPGQAGQQGQGPRNFERVPEPLKSPAWARLVEVAQEQIEVRKNILLAGGAGLGRFAGGCAAEGGDSSDSPVARDARVNR